MLKQSISQRLPIFNLAPKTDRDVGHAEIEVRQLGQLSL